MNRREFMKCVSKGIKIERCFLISGNEVILICYGFRDGRTIYTNKGTYEV
jgi:hypothetical protein